MNCSRSKLLKNNNILTKLVIARQNITLSVSYDSMQQWQLMDLNTILLLLYMINAMLHPCPTFAYQKYSSKMKIKYFHIVNEQIMNVFQLFLVGKWQRVVVNSFWT